MYERHRFAGLWGVDALQSCPAVPDGASHTDPAALQPSSRSITMTIRHTVALIGTLATLASTPALAEEVDCTGTIGAVRLDNIFVPDGATCTLEGTRAQGNVVVGTGATLIARSIKINGNVQAEGATRVAISGTSSVGGSVQLVQGGSVSVQRAIINGSLQMESNNGPISAVRNTIGADLQAFQNTGGVKLTKNRIDGNLQCKSNSPAPVGSGNQAASKEDQCAAL
jgi:hypothetical protein